MATLNFVSHHLDYPYDIEERNEKSSAVLGWIKRS